jgi:UDPglucose--hexose-1-phosphate uridylyltransferase
MRIEKDNILEHYSYISQARASKKKPLDFLPDELVHSSQCVFCPGNEAQTPKEIGRINDEKGNWKVRWFPNKFSAVSPDESVAYGKQEVIVETPSTSRHLWDFSDQDFFEVVGVYQDRMCTLLQDDKIRFVGVFKNHGRESGASLVHAHSQVFASSVPSSRMSQKQKRVSELGHCPYCRLVQDERKSRRFIAENENFIAFCPQAPRYSFEAWIVAKRHEGDFLGYVQSELRQFTSLLSTLLKLPKKQNASFCFSISHVKTEPSLHFHVELLPRLHKWGGFELSSGDYIIGVPPEDAARMYRA